MKQIKILLGGTALLLLSGCSVSTEFFIQNLTSLRQTVTLNYKENMSSDLTKDSYGRQGLNYEDGIVNPRYFIKNKNLKSLEKIVVNDSVIRVELPAHSTTRIGKSQNYNWQSRIKSMEIQNQKYTIQDLEKKAEKIKYDYIYRIE